jgi:hypothetical protein
MEAHPDRRAVEYTTAAPFRGTAAEDPKGGFCVTIPQIFAWQQDLSSSSNVGLLVGTRALRRPCVLTYRTGGEADRTSGEVQKTVRRVGRVKTLQMLYFFSGGRLPHPGGNGPHLGGSRPHLGGRKTAPWGKKDRTPGAVGPHLGGRITAPRGKIETRLSCKSGDFLRFGVCPCSCSCFRFGSVLTTGQDFLGEWKGGREALSGGGFSRG